MPGERGDGERNGCEISKVGTSNLEDESCVDVCKELEVEAADPLVWDDLGREQKDVMARCES